MELPLLRQLPGHRKHRISQVPKPIDGRPAPPPPVADPVVVNDKTKAMVVADAIKHQAHHSEKQIAMPRGPEFVAPVKEPPPLRGFDHHASSTRLRSSSSRNSSRRRSSSTATSIQAARTPQEVLACKDSACELTPFEVSEIVAFPLVYCIATADVKLRNGVSNQGFDDDKGDYIVNVHDHIAYRYDVVGHLGRGSFGHVIKCYDMATRQMVAVKIVRNKQKFQEQSIVEAELLKHLNTAEGHASSNVVAMLETFTFRNHLVLVFELLSINLYEYLKLEQFRGLPIPLLKKIATDILQCLVFLGTHGVVHCDLKPENILLRKPRSSQICIVDFGSSCMHNKTFFTYIQSRFYRAPEVILGLPYGSPIDMWSFGCIVGELFTGYPVFPGENEAEQLACIMEVFNVPPKHMIDTCKRRKHFFDELGTPIATTNTRGRRRRPASRELKALIKCQDAKLVDLLFKCFRWDPATRLTPREAMEHDWLAAEKNKPMAAAPVVPSKPPTEKTAPGSSSIRSSLTTFLRKPMLPPAQENDDGGRVELSAILPKLS
ncbi:hypothetical protein LEN26_005286 [Aphanomyces euteiches]|nr:hypothetical protein AeMF1_003172 [Aphanomyces euteiches]KAH9140329.1 hypothetical protein LEN26_005286 [Aphanomyces euteiches]KAH9187875.1 hypothetical protein AeNC1_010152 [Aphanomyces euteiches]